MLKKVLRKRDASRPLQRGSLNKVLGTPCFRTPSISSLPMPFELSKLRESTVKYKITKLHGMIDDRI